MTRSIATGRLRAADCRLEDLVDVLAERTDPAEYPHAAEVVDEVLVYRSDRLRAAVADGAADEIAAELRALSTGPGSWCSAGRSRTARCSTGPPRRSRS
jgi:hypothetical protein